MSTKDLLVTSGFGGVADAFHQTVSDDGSSGAALSVWVDGAPVVDMWGGVADARDGRAFTSDTLSVIFSCTKGIASVVIAMLIERGMMPAWDTPVVEVWPEFGAHGKDRVTLGDLLAHRGGVSAPRRDLKFEEALDGLAVADALAEQEPLWPPREDHQYHTITHGSLTAKLVTLVTGQSIGSFFDGEVARPLAADAWIGLPESQEPRVARLVEDPAPQPPLEGTPEAVNWVERAANLFGSNYAEVFNAPRLHRAELAGVSGIATASGLAKIWSATVTPTDGVRLIGDGAVEALRAVRSQGPSRFVVGPPPFQSWGAGVMVPSGWNPYLSPRSFGHDGAGGQVAFADADARVGFAYVTNRMGDAERGQSVVRALAKALG